MVTCDTSLCCRCMVLVYHHQTWGYSIIIIYTYIHRYQISYTHIYIYCVGDYTPHDIYNDIVNIIGKYYCRHSNGINRNVGKTMS